MFNLVIIILAMGAGHPTRWYGPTTTTVGHYKTEADCKAAAKTFKPDTSELGLGGAMDQIQELRVAYACIRSD